VNGIRTGAGFDAEREIKRERKRKVGGLPVAMILR
jgi:hypothetical protein